MPPGDVIDNGAVRLEMVRTDPDLLEMRATYRAGSGLPPLHYHPRQEEVFRVERGSLRFRVGDDWRTLVAGDELVVPVAAPHQAQNASATEEAVVRWLVRPALATERFFRSTYAAVAAGQSKNLLHMSLILRAFRNEFALAGPPRVVQTCVFGLLAPVARALGHRLAD